MLKPIDVLVVVGLLREGRTNWTVRSLAAELSLPPATVHRSLQRLGTTPAYVNGHVAVHACEQLLTNALPFVAPPQSGTETRGMPTAWAAAPLVDAFAPTDSLPPVWPDPHGEARGIALTPLHPSVPALARRDQEMYALLALVDGLRVGGPRVHELAADQLRTRLFGGRA